MAKEGMDWLTGLFYELTVAIFRCCEHINRRNPQNCLVLILVDCVLKKSCYRLSINVKKQTILS